MKITNNAVVEFNKDGYLIYVENGFEGGNY